MAEKTTKEIKLRRLLERSKIYGPDFSTQTSKELEKVFSKLVDSCNPFETIISLKEGIELYKKLPTPNEQETKTFYADLNSHLKKIEKQLPQLFEEISKALLETSDRIPTNVYNIKDTLRDFSSRIELENIQLLIGSCKSLSSWINRIDNSLGTLYTKESLEASYQQGFEKGYSKGVSAASQVEEIDRL